MRPTRGAGSLPVRERRAVVSAVGKAWVEYLDGDECWRLLAQNPVGRVGVIVDSGPEIYPVNYVADHRTIVFRTESGNKLHGLHRSPSACFEADGLDMWERTGWSVLVKGRAEEITGADELRRAAELPLQLWSIGVKQHWIRITPRDVTGRRIHRTAT